MLEELLTSRYGSYLVMLMVFGAIIFLLRFLFGPRGVFRDPMWDKKNEEIRAEDHARREARRQEWERKHGDR